MIRLHLKFHGKSKTRHDSMIWTVLLIMQRVKTNESDINIKSTLVKKINQTGTEKRKLKNSADGKSDVGVESVAGKQAPSIELITFAKCYVAASVS